MQLTQVDREHLEHYLDEAEVLRRLKDAWNRAITWEALLANRPLSVVDSQQRYVNFSDGNPCVGDIEAAQWELSHLLANRPHCGYQNPNFFNKD